MLLHPERWGKLRERYEQDRPHKMLALDGGGIRGLLTLGILENVEQVVGKRLCEYFDYIAGTSTGAIIATGLARGLTVAELIQFYRKNGVEMFQHARLLDRLKNFYTADPLREKLKQVFGEHSNLLPEHLECLLLVVTKNVTTDSAWPISSNPDAKYNDPANSDCNSRVMPIWQLVRASTAAPVYFPPEILDWDPNDKLGSKKFVFVDGGVTPYNNPAFLLYRMATEPAYRLNWKTGEENLLLVSIGTGAAEGGGVSVASPNKNIASNVAGLPGELMYGILVDQDINCRAIGRCTYGAKIDSELGDMIPRHGYAKDAGKIPLDTDLGRRFLYARYNADLSKQSLDAHGFSHVDAKSITEMDNVGNMEDLLAIGREMGKSVAKEHFGKFL